MRPSVFNAAVQWFCIGLLLGLVGGAASSCHTTADHDVTPARPVLIR